LRIVYLDCFAGIAGDMAAAALLDLMDEDAWPDLEDALDRLGLPGCRVSVRRVRKDGFAAVDFETSAESGHPPHRRLADIEALIRAARLDRDVERDALAMFRVLARAEARVHGVGEGEIGFHEVGAADSIIDIVSIAWAARRLDPERIVCSPLPLGSGFVDCAHGRLPVPAPATLAILEGLPVLGGGIPGETVTPTGAAAAVVLASSFGPLPPSRILRVGVGAGKAEKPVPNLLRAYIAEVAAAEPLEVVEIETNLDDMNPEAYSPLMDRLFASGALDVLLAPAQMKKNRPAVVVSVIARPEDLHVLASVLLRHTSTFGVRFSHRSRLCLDRAPIVLDTPYGPISAKEGRLGGEVLKVVPEYEDCRRIAEEKGVPYLEVYEAAQAAARARKA